MNKIEVLLQKLKRLKVKLECRKKRFEIWQDEIEKKDEYGKASVKELEKSMWFWVKESRLRDRIEYIDNTIIDLLRRKK